MEINDLNLSIKDNFTTRIFYGSQVYGPKLKEKLIKMENNRTYESFFQENKININSSDIIQYSFKLVSNFSSDDLITLNLTYYIPDFTDIESKNESHTNSPTYFTFETLIHAFILIQVIDILANYFFKYMINSFWDIVILILSICANYYECSFCITFIISIVVIFSNDKNIYEVIPLFISFTDQYMLICVFLFIMSNTINKRFFLFFFMQSLIFYKIHFLRFCFSFLYYRSLKNKKIFSSNSKNITKYTIIMTLIYCIIYYIYSMKCESVFQNKIVPPFTVTVNKWYPENNTRLYTELVSEMIEELKKPYEYNDSYHPCTFSPISKGNSTPKDLIIIQAGQDVSRANLAIKSLRTSGCKARIFLVALDKDNISLATRQLHESAGVKSFILRRYLAFPKAVMLAMRFALSDELFSSCEDINKYVNRFFYFDSFDTAFQSDPLFGEWENNTLYVSSENHLMGTNWFMLEWFREIRGFEPIDFLNKTVYCTGIFGGYPNVVRVVGQMIHSFYLDWKFKAQDQVQYNILIHYGMLEKVGIKIYEEPNWVSIAMILSRFDAGRLGSFQNKTGFKPAAIHQHVRSYNLLKPIIESCP